MYVQVCKNNFGKYARKDKTKKMKVIAYIIPIDKLQINVCSIMRMNRKRMAMVLKKHIFYVDVVFLTNYVTFNINTYIYKQD